MLEVFASSPNGGSSDLAIQVFISDNIGIDISSVTIEAMGSLHNILPISVDANYIGIYEAILSDIPTNSPIVFTITASDINGNTTIVSYQYFNGQTSRLGIQQCLNAGCTDGRQFQGKVSNPVSTQLGNKVEIIPVISYAGPGAAAINLELTYNSQSTTPGYFGSGYSSLLDMSLGIFNNALFQGIRITFADGHTADFEEPETCNFVPTSAETFDTLECGTEGGYRLTTVYQMIYDFDDNGKVTAISDLNHNQLTIEYENDLPSKLVSDTERELEFVYGDGGDADETLIVEVNGTGGKTVSFDYTLLRLDNMTNPNGGVWQFEYEERSVGLSVNSNGDVVDSN